MPLTEEQLNQVQFISLQDYCTRVDQLETLEDKLAFSTRYILTYRQDPNFTPDCTIEKLIQVAHMKFVDKSADMRSFYHETDVNRGRDNEIVDPTVTFYGYDLGNQMFLVNPVGYLKGQAERLSRKINLKSWKSDADIANEVNYGVLRQQVFTDEFAKKMTAFARKPTANDIQFRMEFAFGGPRGLKKAYANTKPGVLSSMFGTRSVASKNLDEAWKSFTNPNHALHGDSPTIEKAAKEYLQHVLPNWKPDRLHNIPKPADIARLSGTKKARAVFSINLLNAVKAQKEMESDYTELFDYCEAQEIAFDNIPVKADWIIIDDGQKQFQKQISEESFDRAFEEEEKNEIKEDDEELSNESVSEPEPMN